MTPQLVILNAVKNLLLAVALSRSLIYGAAHRQYGSWSQKSSQRPPCPRSWREAPATGSSAAIIPGCKINEYDLGNSPPNLLKTS